MVRVLEVHARWLLCPAIALAALLLEPRAGWSQEVPNLRFGFYGQINQGVLVYGDGGVSRTYAPVDNANANSRAGINLDTRLGGWDTLFNVELQYQAYPSDRVNQRSDALDWHFRNSDIRHLEFRFANARFGRFWLGQGSMASDNTAEVDLSGTSVVAYADVASSAAGNFFRRTDGELSGVTVGDAFDDLDGLGRQMRIRYDTPSFNGFRLKTSFGRDVLDHNDSDLYDVAATYAGALNDFKVGAAVALAHDAGTGTNQVDGSLSILHKPSGLNLTVAGGSRFDQGSGRYGYVKLGYILDCFAIGSTALSVDYYGGTGFNTGGSRSTSVGLAAVQRIEKANVDLWLLWRVYDYDGPAAGYEPGNALLGGVRYSF